MEMPKSPMMSREELRELAGLSTRVTAWYPQGATVRGPFCRWFTCADVEDQYKQHVANVSDDTRFAAAAMNNLLPLLDELEEMEKKVADLQLELILMGRIIE
jgi:hypothetical protein